MKEDMLSTSVATMKSMKKELVVSFFMKAVLHGKPAINGNKSSIF
jgi:hypothetical protein